MWIFYFFIHYFCDVVLFSSNSFIMRLYILWKFSIYISFVNSWIQFCFHFGFWISCYICDWIGIIQFWYMFLNLSASVVSWSRFYRLRFNFSTAGSDFFRSDLVSVQPGQYERNLGAGVMPRVHCLASGP